MSNELAINNKDMLVMKLLHYFITEKGYNPIVLHGIQNEIWLENIEGPYRIVRIMMGYIHNNSQYDFDMFKTKRIMSKIKMKTFSFKLNTLSIFLDLGDYVDLTDSKDINCVNITNEKDLENVSITNVFPDIKDKTKFKEDGLELFTKITNDLNEKNKKDAKMAEDVFRDKRPIVTYALIAINIFVFILMHIFGSGTEDISTLLNFGALSPAYVYTNNEYYRLITSAFIHNGIIHLAFNMYALYIIGKQLEIFYGHYKYAIIYFLSLIFGSLLSLLFMDVSSVSVGASGAIFGLLGAMLYFGYNYRSYFGDMITRQIIPIIVLNLFIGFTIPGIDNAAHLGGLIGGLIASYALGVKHKSSKYEMINGIIVLILALALLIYMAFFR